MATANGGKRRRKTWPTTSAVPVLFIKGIVEGALGKAKELLGTVLGRNDLSEEGEAQQDKADAQRNAGKKEAEANSARAAAKAAEERQRARQ